LGQIVPFGNKNLVKGNPSASKENASVYYISKISMQRNKITDFMTHLTFLTKLSGRNPFPIRLLNLPDSGEFSRKRKKYHAYL
jgi:hypothetical protein